MKRRLNRQQWEAHIQDFKESGLSKAAWCQKQNLSVHRLSYWLRHCSPQGKAPNERISTSWIPMTVPDENQKISAPIRIHMNDATIDITIPFTPQTLLHVIQMVKES